MKYLIVIPELKPCGPINVVKNLIGSSAYKKHSVFLVCIRRSNDFLYVNQFLCLGNIKIIYLDEMGLLFKFKKILSILHDIKPDVVHSHGFYPDVFLSFISGKFKKITTIHNIIYQDYSYRYGVKGYLFSMLHYFFLKFGGFYKIFGCSKEVASSLNKIINSHRVDYVDNGVDIEAFYPVLESDKVEIKKAFDLDSEIIISFCGGVERVKRVPELVEQYISKIKDLNFKFIIIGDGPELDVIQETDKVLKIGRVDNPSIYLKISDIVVSNSSSEGYPMAILEALASGCKVFLSDIPSHKYIIDHYPSCAFDINKLNADFVLEVLCNKLSEEDFYNISSTKMAIDYLEKI